MYRLVCVAPHEYHLKKEPHQDFLNRPPTQNTPYIKSGENLLCIAKARCFVGGHEKRQIQSYILLQFFHFFSLDLSSALHHGRTASLAGQELRGVRVSNLGLLSFRW